MLTAVTGWLLAAALLFLIELGLSILLVSVSALSHVALHRLGQEQDGRLAYLARMHDWPSPHRAAAAVGRQLTLLGGTLALVQAGLAAGWTSPTIVGFALGALIGVLLFDGLVARAVSLWQPRAALRGTAFLVRPTYFALFPLIAPVNRLLTRLARHQEARDEERDEEEEEVEALLEVGERDGILEASESEMMRSIVDLDETTVREIMTPRTDIVALPESATLGEARGALVGAAHSRLPVYREIIDNVVGVLHVRDLLRLIQEAPDGEGIATHLREVMFVPETMSVAALLGEMRVRSHMAIVVDEYGGVAGLVTLEDVLEEIVGDIRDEHESHEAVVRQEEAGAWLIHGGAHVDQIEELFEIELGQRHFDTVGGWVVSRFGRVPHNGEILATEGLRIEVLKADRRRIHLVRVSPHTTEAGLAPATG